jgi:protein-tyrosine sulfotransferase
MHMDIGGVSVRLEEPLTAPIFLISTERSGSTLLRYILDTHSQVCCPGELVSGFLCFHLDLLLSRTLCRAGNGATRSANDSLSHTITRQVVSGIMNAHARSQNKSVWCEKSPWNVTHIELLGRVFPTARFICLYRQCMDVVHSCLEASKYGFMPELTPYVTRNPGNLIAAMADSWLEKNERILAFETVNSSRCFRICYEDMVCDPQKFLPPLFRFLGLEWEPDILVRIFKIHHDQGSGDPKINFTKEINSDSVGRGERLSNGLQSGHEIKIKRVLARLGYPRGRQGNDESSEKGRLADSVGSKPTTVKEVFGIHMPARIRDHAAMLEPVRGTLKFEITGDRSQTWLVKLHGSRSMVSEGDQPADCTVVAPDDVLLAVVSGKLNPLSAWMDGRMRVRGNMELAQTLRWIL